MKKKIVSTAGTHSYTISGAKFNDTNKTITFSGTTSLSGLTTDVAIASVSSGQVLKYNGAKWVNANDADNLASLSDCSISSPSNDKILVFTTDSSLNKWTAYTISGATFNDTNKTITF